MWKWRFINLVSLLLLLLLLLMGIITEVFILLKYSQIKKRITANDLFTMTVNMPVGLALSKYLITKYVVDCNVGVPTAARMRTKKSEGYRLYTCNLCSAVPNLCSSMVRTLHIQCNILQITFLAIICVISPCVKPNPIPFCLSFAQDIPVMVHCAESDRC